MKLTRHILVIATGALVASAAAAACSDSTKASATDGFLTVGQRQATNTDFTRAAESSINGVVSIKSFATPRQQRAYSNRGDDFFNDPFFEFFFGNPYGNRQQPRQQQQEKKSEEESQRQLGLGSGVIISSDGYIVTNNHVIDGAERLEITLNDNRQFNATVIGTDPNTDLALIKIDATDLPVIPMGDSDALKVGEWVLAVGNPFGLTSTVTTGIVSAKARSISSATNGRPMGLESYIQTDAAVNPGNSGGALVNLDGELVGINTAIYSQTGSYAGYSFAIPTAVVTKVATDLKQYGTVQRAFLGITYIPLDAKIAKEKGLDGLVDGLYVESVNDRSTAMEAGLQKGDVITALNNVPTHTSAQLLEQVARMRPGDKVTISYVRDGKKQTATATLYNSQGSTKLTQASTVTDIGCAFKKIDNETRQQLKINSGLQVTGLKDGKFKTAGIKNGFIILDINNSKVSSPEDVEKIYNAILKSNDDHVMFISGLYPTGKKMYYAVDLTD